MDGKGFVFDGSKLQAKRVASGRKRAEMAEILSITPQSYGEMENGKINPSSPNLAKLCMLFNCPAEDFFQVPANFLAEI